MPKKKKDDAPATKGQAKWLMYAVMGNARLMQRLTERKTNDLGLIRGCSFVLADSSAPDKSLLGTDHYIFDYETAGTSALSSEKIQASLLKQDQTWIDGPVHAQFYDEHDGLPKKTRNDRIEAIWGPSRNKPNYGQALTNFFPPATPSKPSTGPSLDDASLSRSSSRQTRNSSPAKSSSQAPSDGTVQKGLLGLPLPPADAPKPPPKTMAEFLDMYPPGTKISTHPPEKKEDVLQRVMWNGKVHYITQDEKTRKKETKRKDKEKDSESESLGKYWREDEPKTPDKEKPKEKKAKPMSEASKKLLSPDTATYSSVEGKKTPVKKKKRKAGDLFQDDVSLPDTAEESKSSSDEETSEDSESEGEALAKSSKKRKKDAPKEPKPKDKKLTKKEMQATVKTMTAIIEKVSQTPKVDDIVWRTHQSGALTVLQPLDPTNDPYAGMDADAVKFNTMVEARTFKDVEVETTMVHQMPANCKFASREKDADWVEALLKKSLKTGKVADHNIKLLVNWPLLIPQPGERVKWPPGPQGRDFLANCVAKGMYPWSGNHTLTMLQKAVKTYSTNILFQKFKTDITVVNLENKEDVDMILQMGYLQNELDDFHKRTHPEDYLLKWHQVLVDDDCFARVQKTGHDYRLEGAYVKHFAKISKLDKGEDPSKNLPLINFVAAMAKTYGDEWDLIVSVIEEQQNAFKALKNSDPRETGVNLWWYQYLQGLSRVHRIALMEQEISLSNGLIQPIRLKNAAMAQKSKDKTTAAILKLYNEKCQAVDDTWEPVESITQVIEKVPGLGDDSFFNPWVAFAHANMTAKFEFPQKFLESVFNIMLTASNSKKALELKKDRKITESTCKWNVTTYMYTCFPEATCVRLLLGDYKSFMTVVKMDVNFELLYMDVNQGLLPLEQHPWDIPEDNPQILADVFVKAAANNASYFSVVIICNVHQSKLYVDVLKSCGYDDIDELTWCKCQVGGRNPAPNERFVSATEHIITARSPKKVGVVRPKAEYGLDGQNAKARYNFFFGPDLRNKLKTAENKVVNPYQRPDWLASSLAAPFVKPYGTAVVFGAGAGGDVQGLLDLGLNVIALEKDKTQYDQLSSALYTYKPKKTFGRAQTWAHVDNLMKLAKEKIPKGDEEDESDGEDEEEEDEADEGKVEKQAKKGLDSSEEGKPNVEGENVEENDQKQGEKGEDPPEGIQHGSPPTEGSSPLMSIGKFLGQEKVDEDL